MKPWSLKNPTSKSLRTLKKRKLRTYAKKLCWKIEPYVDFFVVSENLFRMCGKNFHSKKKAKKKREIDDLLLLYSTFFISKMHRKKFYTWSSTSLRETRLSKVFVQFLRKKTTLWADNATFFSVSLFQKTKSSSKKIS